MVADIKINVNDIEVKKLLKHSYPNINFDDYVNDEKYTFE